MQFIEAVFGHSFCDHFSWGDLDINYDVFLENYLQSRKINSFDHFSNLMSDLWKISINNLLTSNLNKKVCIPLSGGYDSRLILNYFFQEHQNQEILTSTFGIRGSREIKIAKNISEIFNVSHKTTFIEKFNFLSLLDSNSDNTRNGINLLHRALNISCHRSDFILNGFLANTLAGNHLSNIEEKFEDAFDRYLNTEINVNLLKTNFPSFYKNIKNKVENAINVKAFERLNISNYEKIIISQRQKMRIKFILGNDKNFVHSPFADPAIAGLLLGLNSSYRSNQVFYQNWVKNKFIEKIQNFRTSKYIYLRENLINKKFKNFLYILIKSQGKLHNLSRGLIFPYFSNYGRDLFLISKNETYKKLLEKFNNKDYFLIAERLGSRHYTNQKIISYNVGRLY